MFKRLTGNWREKLFAVVAAIILTGFVHSQMNPKATSTVTAEVRCDHLQEGFEASLRENTVPITLSGTKSDVDSVVDSAKAGEVVAWVDLDGLGEGIHSIKFSKIAFPEQLPDTVTSKASVNSVTVKIEARISRTLPVNVKISSPLSAGWSSGRADISPSSATVSGPSSLVDSVDRLVVVAEPTPSRPSVDEYASIRPLDTRGEEVKGIRVAPDVAHVSLKLVEAPANKSVFVSSNVIGQPQFPYRVTKITVTPSSVIVKGKADVLTRTANISTDEVDISGATTDVIRHVYLRLPPGLDVEGSKEVSVAVKIELGSSGG